MPDYATTQKLIYDLQEYAIKLGLDNISALMNFLGKPYLEYPVIHIAGTNGKGSTAFFLAQILTASGVKTGLFTSPHLRDFRERVRIDNHLISEEETIEFWQKVKPLIYERKATFFDTSTAMALDHFRNNKVQAAIIETGLGGRLDSTNIVQPEICVLTPIDYDHQKQLGNNLKSIAAEKAGIIKPNSMVISATQAGEVKETILNHLDSTNKYIDLDHLVNTEIKQVGLTGTSFNLYDKRERKYYKNINAKQVGDFQVDNMALAYATACEFLKKRKIPLIEENLKTALEQYIWPGRLEIVNHSPDIVFDVSHNLAGIKHTLLFLRKFVSNSNLHILTGLVKDKNFDLIALLLAKSSVRTTVCEPDTHRRLDGKILFDEIKKVQKSVQLIKDSRQAFESVKKDLKQEDTLLVIGSHYLIGSLLN